MLSDVYQEVVNFGGQVRITGDCVAEELIISLPFRRCVLASWRLDLFSPFRRITYS